MLSQKTKSQLLAIHSVNNTPSFHHPRKPIRWGTLIGAMIVWLVLCLIAFANPHL